MTSGIRGISPWFVAAWLVLILGHSPAFAKKGRTISVQDDPSAKNGSPEIVLVEISDFQ
jgi:hypothetical protein